MEPCATERSDSELAALGAAGSLIAFESLMRRHERSIHAFVRRRVATAEDAEDLTQQTFVTAWRRLGSYRPEHPFAAWVFTIARRLTIDHYRRSPPATGQSASESAWADPGPDPAAQMAGREEAERLWSLARGVLSERQFTVLWLMYRENRTVKDIADIVGLTSTHVKVLLFRARQILYRRLAPGAASGAAAPTADWAAATDWKGRKTSS